MKKVIYILNLLFLTLSVFGGSVFAAAPEQYILADGTTANVPEGVVDLSSVKNNGLNGNYALTDDNWYYIEGTVPTTSNGSIYVTSGDNVNIVVVGNSKINLGQYAIFVPDNGSISFWAASNNGSDDGVSLEISNSTSLYQGINFVIGNNAVGVSAFSYSKGNFGDITFNSGSYTVVNNNKTTPGPTIGSDTTSGGTITVNQEAEVTAYSQNEGTTSIGVTAGQSCNIEVNGGTLRALFEKYKLGQVINVGGKGSLTLNNQGYIVSGVGLTEQSNWNLESGIVAVGPQQTANGTYTWGAKSPWDAYVYGEVAIPTPQGKQLTPPVISNSNSSGYYGSLIIDDGTQLTIGNDENQADFFVGGKNSNVNNN